MSRRKGIAVLITLFGLLPSNAFSSENGDAGLSGVCGLEFAHCEGSRMVRDFGTGMRWIIQRDGKNPGWPAKLVRISGGEDDAQSWIPGGRKLVEKAGIVRGGDSLAISEETATFKAVLEGVALSSGVSGDVISVRLRFSGRIVRAQAMSRGAAKLVRAVSEGR